MVGALDEFPGLAQADAATASRPKSPSVTAFAMGPSLASIRLVCMIRKDPPATRTRSGSEGAQLSVHSKPVQGQNAVRMAAV